MTKPKDRKDTEMIAEVWQDFRLNAKELMQAGATPTEIRAVLEEVLAMKVKSAGM